VQDDGDVILPERVLVLETKEPLENFRNALQRIEGLELLAERFRLPAADADEETRHRRYLHLTLPNQRGLEELLRHWRRYQDGENAPHGLKPLWEVFRHLEDLRRWGLKDRIPPEVRASLEEQLQDIDDELMPDGIGLEIELWPYTHEETLQRELDRVVQLVRETDGAELVKQCCLPDAGVGIVLAQLPAALVRELLRHDRANLIERPDLQNLAESVSVQSFGAAAQAAGDPAPEEQQQAEDGAPDDLDARRSPVNDTIRVTVMDTPAVQRHAWLDRWLTLQQDLYGLESRVDARLRRHGTAMVSLAIHGELGQPATLDSPVANLPVMEAFEDPDGRTQTAIPTGEILADVLHIAIRHLFMDDGYGGPAAPDTSVISLSLGDANRPYHPGRVSAAARVLDWLAREHNVLILVAAGNHPGPLHLDVSDAEFQQMSAQDRRHAVREALERDMLQEGLSRPSILSPAEAANVLTVGALDWNPGCNQNGPPNPRNQHRFVADDAWHAPYSRLGPGVEGQVKPDILFWGGSPIYNIRPGSTNARLKLAPSDRFGCVEASAPSGTGRNVGTSGATARAANAAGRIVEMLNEQTIPDPVPAAYHPVLTKALLVHGAQDTEWHDDAAQFYLGGNASRPRDRERIARFCGHGVPDVERVLACTETRVTVLGFDTLEADDDAARVFHFPIPGDLNGQRVLRRTVLTLAWFADCDGQRLSYKRERLELRANPGELRLAKKQGGRMGTTGGNGYHMDSRGTVIHQVFEGSQSTAFAENATLDVKVQRRRVSDLPARQPIHFGLAVTLDLSDAVPALFNVNIYDRVAERLGIRAPVAP